MMCCKVSFKKIEQTEKRGLRKVYNKPHLSLEELLIRDQGISVHRKQINTFLTETFKTFSVGNPYFITRIFTQKHVIYNPRILNLLPSLL